MFEALGPDPLMVRRVEDPTTGSAASRFRYAAGDLLKALGVAVRGGQMKPLWTKPKEWLSA